MNDLYNNLAAAIAIAPAALDADNTPAAIDLKGYRSAMIDIIVGIGGITFTSTNRVDFKLTHSVDNSTYDAVEAGDVQGVTPASGGIVKSLTAAHAAASNTRIGYIGGRRYLKLLADFGGSHASPTPLAALVLLGDPDRAPVA